MKVVEVELSEETYDFAREEADRSRTTLDDVVQRGIDHLRGAAAASPVGLKLRSYDLGKPKLPVSEWREASNEGRAL